MPKPNCVYSNYSDLQLFELVKNDSTPAFEELYSRYWPQLVDAAFKRLQSRQKAEDLVQDVFISIYNRRHSIALTTSFSAYIHRALKFSVLNEIRSSLVREKYLKALFFSDNSKTDFVDSLETKQLDRRIRQTLDTLPQKCKEVFLMSRNEQTAYKEISSRLNISISTVEKHMVRALRIFRENLKEFHLN